MNGSEPLAELERAIAVAATTERTLRRMADRIDTESADLDRQWARVSGPFLDAVATGRWQRRLAPSYLFLGLGLCAHGLTLVLGGPARLLAAWVESLAGLAVGSCIAVVFGRVLWRWARRPSPVSRWRRLRGLLLRRLPGDAEGCLACQAPFRFAQPHRTGWTHNRWLAALCEDCWEELSSAEARAPYYRRAVAILSAMAPGAQIPEIEEQVLAAVVAGR